MPIDQELSDEIEQKREKIAAEPNAYLHRANRIKKALQTSARGYSYYIEHPQERSRLLYGGIRARSVKRDAARGFDRLKMAWDKLHQAKRTNNFTEIIDPSLIISIGGIIDPSNEWFRRERVSLNLKYVPPNPIKVPELVDQLIEETKKGDLTTVERAAYFHLVLAGIQPFRDGNKRTARLFQDAILDDYGLPPAVIPSGERVVYIDLLEEALIGRQANDLRKQRPFFDYIGGKVNHGLDQILNDLDPKGAYAQKKKVK